MERSPIEDFPGYLVDREGRIFSERTDRQITPSKTRQGLAKITLHRDGDPHTRALAPIVAKAHLYNDHDPDVFNTPIHLDNDPLNNHVDNLAWRPRWFAIKYQSQYWNLEFRHSRVPVEDTSTGIVYDSIMDVCQKFGVLFVDVMNSCGRGTYVFPTWKVFRFLK